MSTPRPALGGCLEHERLHLLRYAAGRWPGAPDRLRYPAGSPDADHGAALDDLTLEQKAARLFWVTVHGSHADGPHPGNRPAFGVDTPAQVIRTHRPGGVVLFAWAGNTEQPAQVAQLTRDLRAAAAGHPLGVAIDEEGGRVRRLGPPATAFPSARAVAAAAAPDLAERRWRAAAVELAAVGVTANLAPVVDLGNPVNPVLGDRTFAEHPAAVAAQAALAVRGLQAGGVAAVAKHFPGHGATDVDSHEALPVVALSRRELEPHLEAFRRLLATGRPAGIMTAHLLVRALDAAQPATVSPAVLTGLLRRELGYTGAVVTDSLSMAGIRGRSADADVAVAALAAGADVLLTPPDLVGAVAAVCEAVRAGRIREDRLAEALRRGAALATPSGGASSAAAPGGASSAAVTAAVGREEHRAVAAALAARAVRVAADPAGRLPLAVGPLLVAGSAGSGARTLVDALRRRGRAAALLELAAPQRATPLADAGQAQVDQTTRDASPALAPRALAAAADAGPLVLVRRVPELDAAHQDGVLAALAHRQAGAILVETGTATAPWAGPAHTVLRTFCAGPASLDAAAELLAVERHSSASDAPAR